MAIVVGKPNLHVVLKKRRRTVGKFLSEHGVDSTQKLNDLVSVLEKEYAVTPGFLAEAQTYLNTVTPAKVRASTPKPEPEIVASLPTEPESVAKKSKKQPRRQTKNADEGDVDKTEDAVE